jgi:2-octaprenyl-6-methoxyphenol hydroxylase
MPARKSYDRRSIRPGRRDAVAPHARAGSSAGGQLRANPGRTRSDGRIERQAAVVGGGIVGLSAALALARAGASVVLVDRAQPEAVAAVGANGRTAALLRPAIDFLEGLEVWRAVASGGALLRRLRIVDQGQGPDSGGSAEVLFEAEEIGESEFGFNVANHDLRRALGEAAANEPAIRLLLGEDVCGIRVSGGMAQLALVDGGEVRCALVLGADGRDSSVRRAARIAEQRFDYGQMALTCSFAHARDHGDCSTELHRPGGPFTMVPMAGSRSSLVWVERTAEAERLLSLDDHAFATELERLASPWVGAVREITRRRRYPLIGVLARRLVAPRVALVGEAAHVLSPIGAQGLNLSLRDVAALAALVASALARRTDIGDPELLAAYERRRMPDIRTRFLTVDGLNRAVASEVELVRLARAMGLRVVGAVPPLRRSLMRAMMRPFEWPALAPFSVGRG